MKKTIILLLLLSVVSMANAQRNYQDGYILTNANDTLYGRIDFRTDAVNKKKCQFIANGKAEAQVYYPGDIIGYRLTDTGKYYVSQNIKIEGVSQSLFLEYLVQGEMNLYYCRENGQDYYFFEKPNDSIITITKKADRIRDDNRYVPDEKYKSIINYVFSDYSSITKKVDGMEFKQKAFIDVAKKYHDAVCKTGEECVVFENKNPDRNDVIFKFSAYVGIQQSTLYLHGDQMPKFKFSNIAPVVGGQMSLVNPRWSKSFSFVFDVSLSQFKGNETKVIITDVTETRKIYGCDFKAYSLSFRPGVKYTYSKHKLRPVIEGGITLTTLLNTSATLSYKTIDGGKEALYPDKKLKLNKGVFLGAYVALGLDYNIRKEQAVFVRFVMENYLDHARGVSGENAGINKIKTPHIKLGYTF